MFSVLYEAVDLVPVAYQASAFAVHKGCHKNGESPVPLRTAVLYEAVGKPSAPGLPNACCQIGKRPVLLRTTAPCEAVDRHGALPPT